MGYALIHERMFLMALKKRIAAAALSVGISVSSAAFTFTETGITVNASSSSSVYYDDFDVVYQMDADLFCMKDQGEYIWNDKFIAAIERAVGRKSYDEITFLDLTKITSLNLSGMGLTSIPKVVEYMTRLRTLNVSDNCIVNENVRDLDLSDCVMLSSVDISSNYLTSTPAWLLAIDIPTKKIDNNLINTKNQRHITISPDAFYFMVGDEFDEKLFFDDRVLPTLRLSDNTYLPTYYYDPNLPTLNYDETDNDVIRNDIEIFFDASSSLETKDGITTVKSAGTFTGKISIYSTSTDNKNTEVEFKVFFLDGKDSSSTKLRLKTLIEECDKLTKDGYTSTSWTDFEASLKIAKSLVDYESADNDMLADAFNSLQASKNALVNGVSSDTKKVLTDLIAVARTFKEEDYTPESWKVFSAAVEMLNEASRNTDTSVKEANEAIKTYQDAQKGLKETQMSVPSTAPKADFDAIYGENKTVTYTGYTRDGYGYKWVFNGQDIKTPKDFNPEISFESTNEEKIRYAVESADDYHIISFKETGEFPGLADITIDISKTYTNGTYRLYKWDSSKPSYIKDVTVVNGTVNFTIDSGGDYFISSVLQNFQMISSNFNIDHKNLTIAGKFKKRYTAGEFRKSLENGEAILLRTAEGTDVFDDEYIATGMTACAPNSDISYTIVIPGDCDGDGMITAFDASKIMQAIMGSIQLDGYAVKAACDVNSDGWIRADDAAIILQYIMYGDQTT